MGSLARVGALSCLRMRGVSLPLWLCFWNSKTGEQGWPSRPLSPWTNSFREASVRWAEATDLQVIRHSFPGAVLGWNTGSWRSWVRRLGDALSGILYARGAALRGTLANPECISSSGGGDGAVSAGPTICDSVPRRGGYAPSSAA